jgi:predicted GH43/DUF377 family glycosyl hydrolase
MKNLDINQATGIAHEFIGKIAKDNDIELEILSDSTIRVENGWLFFYNTVEFIRTGISTLAGNGPILVTDRGEARILPSSMPWQEAIKKI